MLKIISKSSASISLIFLLSLLIIFHFLVMIDIIPYKMVWGGRIKNQEQLLIFEALSIGVNLLMIFIISINNGWFKLSINPRVIQIILWIMFAVFILNTIGNLLSINPVEKLIFTPLTLILSVLVLRLVTTK